MANRVGDGNGVEGSEDAVSLVRRSVDAFAMRHRQVSKIGGTLATSFLPHELKAELALLPRIIAVHQELFALARL